MTFLNPAYLWALSALAIPVAIHLLSRKEGRVIRVGSLRHVEESNTSQFKSIRPNEILIFILRALMFICMVFFLAGAQCTSSDPSSSRWLVVETGIDKDPIYRPTIDSLVKNGFEQHFLAPGFPLEAPSGVVPNYRMLALDLGTLGFEVVVISWSKANRFLGTRIPIPPNVRWITADHAPITYPAYARQFGDSLLTRTATSSGAGTNYSSQLEFGPSQDTWRDSIAVDNPISQRVHLFADADHEDLKRVFDAALSVLKKDFHLPVVVTGDAAAADWVFWLSDARPKLPATVHAALLDAQASGPIFEQTGPNTWAIRQLKDRSDAIRHNLVLELYRLMYSAEKTDPSDVRSLPEAMAFSNVPSTDQSNPTPTRDLAALWISILLVTLCLERWLSWKRNQ